MTSVRPKSSVGWEHVERLVDRQISPARLHVWPFPHSIPIDVRHVVMDRQQDVPLHRPDHFEVVVFDSGELGYEVNGRTCTVRKNDVLAVGDRIYHRCLPASASQPQARTVVLSFLPQLVHSGAPAGDDLQYLMPFTLPYSSVSNVVPARAGLSREILDFMERIRAELPGTTLQSRLAIKTYLKMIMLALLGHYSRLGEMRSALERQQESARRLGRLLEHIQQHYDEPIRVSDAARLCAMSACCFMHFFKEATGQSFVAYLNCFRVMKAGDLLVATERPVSDIAQETGFCNQSYFGVIFKRHTGMTPLKYRLSCGGGTLLKVPFLLPQTAVSPPSTVKIPPTQ